MMFPGCSCWQAALNPSAGQPDWVVSEEEDMKLTLHHINLCSTDVPAMDEFYRSVLGLEPEPA